MRRNRTGSRMAAAIIGALLLGTLPAGATIIGPPLWCTADCNGDGTVAINEMITCVNIALGTSPRESCPACDGDGDGIIGINDLVQAVGYALDPDCPALGADTCGNGTVDGSETCDDGNWIGGDGCAANCTTESSRAGAVELRPKVSALPQVQRGTAVLRTGQPRAVAAGPVGPGDIPVALRPAELRFAPERITGLACVCTRALPHADLGGGLAGAGTIHCGPDAAADVNYRIIQDHNTTPGDPHNREAGTPDDPECDDTSSGPAGTIWRACREGSTASCPGWDDAAAHPHPGVCNGPRVLTQFGGAAPRGSAVLVAHLATTLLADGGACATTRPMRDGACLYESYGSDCLPCTEDDVPTQAWSDLLLLTSGSAEGAVFDRDNDAMPPFRALVGQNPIGGCFPFLCQAGPSAPFDCDALAAAPGGGLDGAALAFALPVLDGSSFGDVVSQGVLAFPTASGDE